MGACVRAVIPASAPAAATLASLYVCDAVFVPLAQDLEDMAAALGPCIQAEPAMMHQRHLARHRHVAPPDQSHIGDRVMGGATRAGGDQRRAVAGEAGDAVDPVVSRASVRVIASRMVVSRRASIDLPPRGAEEKQVTVRTPAVDWPHYWLKLNSLVSITIMSPGSIPPSLNASGGVKAAKKVYIPKGSPPWKVNAKRSSNVASKPC